MLRKKLKRPVLFLLTVVLCFSLIGCQSEAERLAAEAAAEESRLAAEKAAEEARYAEIERKIIEALERAPAVDGFSLRLASAIVNTFHQYTWEFEPYRESETSYMVTFSGEYSPNPRDLPQLSYRGIISWIVNVEDYTVTLYRDPDDISTAFLLLALPY